MPGPLLLLRSCVGSIEATFGVLVVVQCNRVVALGVRTLTQCLCSLALGMGCIECLCLSALSVGELAKCLGLVSLRVGYRVQGVCVDTLGVRTISKVYVSKFWLRLHVCALGVVVRFLHDASNFEVGLERYRCVRDGLNSSCVGVLRLVYDCDNISWFPTFRDNLKREGVCHSTGVCVSVSPQSSSITCALDRDES